MLRATVAFFHYCCTARFGPIVQQLFWYVQFLTNKNEITLFQLFAMQMLNALLPTVIFFLPLSLSVLTLNNIDTNCCFPQSHVHCFFPAQHFNGISAPTKPDHLWHTVQALNSSILLKSRSPFNVPNLFTRFFPGSHKMKLKLIHLVQLRLENIRKTSARY